jgi:dolichol-phosphate mannosyltransferase
MMRATEALCCWCLEQEDITHVYLRVFSDNQRALNLYSKAGFVELFRKPLVRIETSNGWKWEEAPELHRAPVSRHFVTMRLGRDRIAPPVISVVVPARNEEGNLTRAYSEITRVLEALAEPYEVLLIDNASSDKTRALAEEICDRDNRWRYLRFSRDFGVETSMLAGLRAARGDATVILFSDLQDPPELISTLMARWREGHDVVYGVVNQRGGEPWWKCLGARLFYRVMSAAGETPLPPDATDFRLLSRRAREAVASCGERNRYFRGLSHWVGFPSCAMPYDRRPRLAGTSKAPPFYMMALAARALTAFSLAPVHLLGLGSLACGSIALATTAIWVIGLISGGMLFDLTASMVLQWWTLAAVMVAGWTCGEYAGRTYRESRARPEYLVESSIRWENQNSSAIKDTISTDRQDNRFSGYHTSILPVSSAPAHAPRTTTLPGRQRPAWAPVSRP